MLPPNPLKVLVIGSGGREHALAWKLAQSAAAETIYCAPGNGGTAREAKCENVPISVMDFDKIENFAVEKKIDLVVVGPDNPLADGIVDQLCAKGLRVFGPTKEQSKIEWSKAHAKEFMSRAAVPTPRYVVCKSHGEATKAAKENKWVGVVKVDGLALGKGVFVCDDEQAVQKAIDEIFHNKAFGSAGETVLLEERVDGEELSLLMLCDGKTLLPLEPCQDHKRRFDGDLGPNTGGMGAYSPVPLYDRSHKEIEEKILSPLRKALQDGTLSFKGVLYAGIMVCGEESKPEPTVLEFNARFGDPETQALMPRLESDLLEVLYAATEGNLDKMRLEWSNSMACCVVASAETYPQSSSKGEKISIGDLGASATLFQAGTKFDGTDVLTDGGRVLAVVGGGKSLEAAAQNAYSAITKVSFAGMDYRKDIGRRAFNKCLSN